MLNSRHINLITLLMLVTFGVLPSSSADEVIVDIEGQQRVLIGEILIEAQNGGIYFVESSGKIWLFQADQIRSKSRLENPTPVLTKKQIGIKLLEELPSDFRIYETQHYVIAYQTSLTYAKWVASLYESRLYRAFESFWVRKKKVALDDPKFPLVAIIFDSRSNYQAYMDRELGPGQQMVAYYNIQNNRVTMFDLTSEYARDKGELSERRIEQILGSPGAVSMVATMIHEATHQLIFNRGIQSRFSDSPLWLHEGLAMYFEAPNLKSKRGWQRPGLVFDERLLLFRQRLANRQPQTIENLVSSNQFFEDPNQSLGAYAESWALVHFLVNRRSKEFTAYMKFMGKKKPLVEDSSDQRLSEFKQFFGESIEELENDFLKYIRRLRYSQQ